MKRLGLLLLMMLWLGGAAQAALRYELILLASPDNYFQTYANAINNRGEVVGFCLNSAGERVATYWGPSDNYAPVIIGVPQDWEQADARGINDSGDVVGVAYANSFSESAVFTWNVKTRNIVILQGLPGSMRDEVSSIHSIGWAFGYSVLPSGSRACIFRLDQPAMNISGGNYGNKAIGLGDWGARVAGNELSSRTNGWKAVVGTQGFTEVTLLTSGTTESTAMAINYFGDVVGTYDAGNRFFHAFRWDGTLHDLGTLGGSRSEALAINKSRQVVGWSNTTEGGTSGFLYQPGKGMSDLNSLDVIGKPPAWQWWFGQARGINDRGEIVGWSLRGGLGYLLRPQVIDIPALIMFLLLN